MQKLDDVQLCGINSKYWREFLKTFQEGTTDQQARAALERLKQKVEGTVDIPKPTAQSALVILDELERFLGLPN